MDACRRTWLVRLAAGLVLSSGLIPGLLRAAVGQDAPQRVIDVQIENRRVVVPEGAIRVFEKDVIALRWVSDEPVRLHLHGYDQEIDVRPGVAAVMSVKAHATGRFPITSHGWGGGGHGDHALTYLEVYPR